MNHCAGRYVWREYTGNDFQLNKYNDFRKTIFITNRLCSLLALKVLRCLSGSYIVLAFEVLFRSRCFQRSSLAHVHGDMASICEQLKYHNKIPFGMISGTFPVRSAFVGRSIINFSSSVSRKVVLLRQSEPIIKLITFDSVHRRARSP